MKKTFSVEQKSKSDNFDSYLIFLHYILVLLPRIMEIKSPDPKSKQDQTAKKLRCSTSTLQRYRLDINMLSIYRIPSSSHKGDQRLQIRIALMTDIESITSKDVK